MKDQYNIRYRSLLKIAGWLILLESGLMVVPLAVSLFGGEPDWKAFAIAALVAGGTGGVAVAGNRGEHVRLNRREGYLLISFIWIVFSLFGMLPFMLCTHPVGLTDAFFETMSGFTTTGASIFSDVEVLGRGILLWRAMIQWLGGLGIVLFLIALLPALNDSGGIALFNAEMTGISHDKLHPQIRRTAASLWLVYSVLTAVMVIFLLAGGMNLFDSLCQAMTTLSTGGFSTRNASIAAWGSTYIASVVTVFMLLGGINFLLLYNLSQRHFQEVWKNDVLRSYMAIVFIAWAVTAGILAAKGERGFDALVVAPLFHVASSITSTGFAYSDYGAWGSAAVCVTILLMLCGACAGSTTGGIKIDRISALFKNLRNEVVYTLFPRHMKSVEVGGKVVGERGLIRVMAFISIYLLLTGAGTLLMSFYGYSVRDSFFASASGMGNNGLGLGATGSGFGGLPSPLKWFMSAEMLIGRLEIFTVMVLFYKAFWRR